MHCGYKVRMALSRRKQLGFKIERHGGARSGAGRKKILLSEPNHVKRELVTTRTPVHVTLKFREGLPSLRHRNYLAKFADAVCGARKFGLRVSEFSVQRDHIHFLAEADGNESLSKGMQSLKIRLAKAIKNLIDQKTSAPVFRGRYHAHVLKTPTEVRRALAYVLQNTAKHSRGHVPKLSVLLQDPFCSLHSFGKPVELFGASAQTRDARAYFEAEKPWTQKGLPDFLTKPQSWLLRTGWLRAKYSR